MLLVKMVDFLLFNMICDSSIEIRAELYVERVGAAIDMPSATRLRKLLCLVMIW